MKPSVKYQVFISSTYKDLVEERQAAVLTVLRSQHIPAGMELFSAGDKSQLEEIKKWIKESDVYMLLLGGRYGTLEPTTQLSYTEIEYNYAIELKKPYFALVITDEALNEKVKKRGQEVFEYENRAKYESFKKVVLSKTSAFFSNINEIEKEISFSLRKIENENTLVGWIRRYPYNAVNYGVKITYPYNLDIVESNFFVKGRFEIAPPPGLFHCIEYNPQLGTYWPKGKINFLPNSAEWKIKLFIGHGDDLQRIIYIVATGDQGKAQIDAYNNMGANAQGYETLAEDVIIVDKLTIILKNGI